MCHSLYLSTTSDLNLVYRHHANFLCFEKYVLNEDDRRRQILLYDNIWFVSNSQGGCSCGFRNSHNDISDYGFHAPLDWHNENEQDIIATKLLYRVIRELLESGHKVDSLEDWDEIPPENVSKFEVSLREVEEDQLLFYVDSHYKFSL